MGITASQVSELRKITDCGMMDCKKVLVETDGDMEKAIDLLRTKGMSKAVKRSGHIAAEGVIVVHCDTADKSSVMLEINCETDFVARDDNFKQFAESLISLAQNKKIDSLEGLSDAIFENDMTVEQARQALVVKLGENINIRRIATINTSDTIASYSHSGRIGVLVAIEGDNAVLAKDLAMHIAASRPSVILPEQVDANMLAKEREICTAQALESGKPENLIEKIVEGRVKKFVNEVSLVGQSFVKEPSITVGQLLESKKATVESFVRFELGEGIEKKTEDFAEEVMAQIKKD